MKNFSSIIIFIIILINVFNVNNIIYAYDTTIDIHCEAISLINIETDKVIFEKNSNTHRSPASTTKIMTYIIVAEHVDDFENTKVTITNEIIESLIGTESSLSGLQIGDTLSIYNLLQCLMISSGNDAAIALANYIGNGNIDAFVDMMNNKAIELGCYDTHFVNPHGLYDPEHYSTTNDIYKMTKCAMSLPYFSEITNTIIAYPFGDDKPPIITTNKLIDPVRGDKYYYKYAKGIKTGYHNQAGYCLTSTAVKDGYSYMCIALGAPSIDENGKKIEKNYAIIDSKELYNWAFNSFELKKVLDSEQPITEVKLKYSWDNDTLLLVPEKNFSTILPKNVKPTSIDIISNVPDYVAAPVKKGDKIGTATLKYANQELATVDLVASEDVNRNIFLYIISIIKVVVTSKWFIASIIIILILCAIYILALISQNKNKYKKRRK